VTNIKIYDGTPIEPGTVAVKLFQLNGREIALCAVDDAGECLLDPESELHGGGLLVLMDTGRIALSPRVMPSLGFDLGADDRLMLDDYAESMTARRAQRFGGKRAAFRVASREPS
jgi:hypothetical protein